MNNNPNGNRTGIKRRMAEEGFRERMRETITNEDEELILKTLDLEPTIEKIKENSDGFILNWYGARVKLLLSFYNKTNKELAFYLGIYESKLLIWTKNSNKDIPPERMIDKLSFFFEIDKRYFTQREIQLRITEQLKIKLI